MGTCKDLATVANGCPLRPDISCCSRQRRNTWSISRRISQSSERVNPWFGHDRSDDYVFQLDPGKAQDLLEESLSICANNDPTVRTSMEYSQREPREHVLVLGKRHADKFSRRFYSTRCCKHAFYLLHHTMRFCRSQESNFNAEMQLLTWPHHLDIAFLLLGHIALGLSSCG